MARRKTPPPFEDATIRALLARVARADVTAAGVLADYLEETDHPCAKRVRRLWTDYAAAVAYWTENSPGLRSPWTAWECRAAAARRLRRRLGLLFRRRWTRLPLARFVR